jgi:alpha-1,6-mannosyltransferase
MTASRHGSLFFLCLTVQGGLVLALSVWARAGAAPSTIVLGLAGSFVPYAGLLTWAPALGDRRHVELLALIASSVFGLTLVFAPPVMSDDLYRYLWEGRLWLEGLNPYRLAPDDPALIPLRSDLWAPINNKPLASIYPPLSQLLFTVAAWLGNAVWTVKLLALVAHVASSVVVSRIAGRPRAALALGLNPLLLSEAALNGHFDVLTGLALLTSVWALSQHRIARAGAAVCVAVGLKAVGVLFVPFFARRPKALAVVSLACGLLLLPLVWWRSPSDAASGPGQFATRWRGNESFFALGQWVADQLVSEDWVGLVARGAVVAALLVLWLVILRRPSSPLEAGRLLIWAVLLLSPQVHPWYLAWLLPMEVFAQGRAGLLWSAAVLCAYAPLDRWVRDGVWEMPAWLQVASYAAVFIALMLDPRRPRLRNDGVEF